MPSTRRLATRLAAGAAVAAFLAGIAPAVHAQWPVRVDARLPQTANGKVDMNAKPLRTADGKVDLSGFWMPTEIVKHLLRLDADLKPGELPLNGKGEALLKERIDWNGKDHPGARCLPSGIPEKLSIPDGLKLVQTPQAMLFLFESRTIYRQVFTDGRPMPPEDVQPTWMGYSVGRWEGDTFVAETRYQNGLTWLDMRGLPAGEKLRVVERYTRPSVGRMQIEVTIDDPEYYTRPWKANLNWTLQPGWELIESICEENNKDWKHMVGK
jgi:hypothetical protein